MLTQRASRDFATCASQFRDCGVYRAKQYGDSQWCHYRQPRRRDHRSEVTVINDSTGIRTAVVTNESGFYSIPSLPIGAYTLVAEKQGFRRYVHSGFVLTTGMVQELNATLDPGPITETVNVTAPEPLVNTRTSEVSDVIDPRTIEALPLYNRRTRGFIRTAGLASFIGNDNLPTYSLGGGRVQSQMVWIDGGTGQNIRIGAGQQNVDPPAEAIQEIKIIANTYAAEYGGSAGGVIIETTKSGGNQLHGSAYEYLRNDSLDAPGFFAPVSAGAKLAPELRYNVFGSSRRRADSSQSNLRLRGIRRDPPRTGFHHHT